MSIYKQSLIYKHLALYPASLKLYEKDLKASVFLSNYTRNISLNQSGQVFALGYFLDHSVVEDKQLTQRNFFQHPDRDRLCFISF